MVSTPPAPDLFATTRFVRRALGMSVGVGAAIAAYETQRILRPKAHLEAEAKRNLGRGILAGVGLELDVTGAFPTSRVGRLVVANHRAAFDIAILLSLVDDAVMLSRGDIKTWPVLGRLAQLGDTLFVDRTDRSDGARAIRTMRKALERRRALCVFPEGTTHGEPAVRPFQPGAFAAARGLPIEVVPVGIAYSSGLEFVEPSMVRHLTNTMRKPDLRAAVVIGEPYALDTRRTDALTRDAHARVQHLFEQASAKVR